MTSPSGRNGDHVTSGPHSKCNSTETVRDTQKVTITDKYKIAYGLSEYVNIRLLWQPEVVQDITTQLRHAFDTAKFNNEDQVIIHFN